MKTTHCTLGTYNGKWVATVYSRYKNCTQNFSTKNEAVRYIRKNLSDINDALMSEYSIVLKELDIWRQKGSFDESPT